MLRMIFILIGLYQETKSAALQSNSFWASCMSLPVGRMHNCFGAVAAQRPTDGKWQIIFGVNDPGHVLGIAASQMRTSSRTIQFGDLAVDGSSALAQGLSWAAWTGKDRQSNKDAAQLMHALCPADGKSLSWCGRGGFVYSFIVSAALAPWYDMHMGPKTQHFLSAFAFYFLTLSRQFVVETADAKGWPAPRRNIPILNNVQRGRGT